MRPRSDLLVTSVLSDPIASGLGTGMNTSKTTTGDIVNSTLSDFHVVYYNVNDIFGLS